MEDGSEYYYNSQFPMGSAGQIMRRSIFTFLNKYQYFTSTPTLLAFPFAVSTLLSQSLISSSHLFPLVHGRLRSLFLAAGFPPSSELFAFLNLKLTQTILSFLFVSPFTLSFLLLSKAAVLHHNHKKHYSWGIFILFNPIFITQLCNSLVILSVNATCFCLLVVSFNCFDVVGLSSYPGLVLLLSAIGAIIYSIILANSYVICNLALILSGKEKRGGFITILKACVLIRNRTATALSLAVPINLVLAAIETLFQYRVVRAYNNNSNSSMVLEGMLISYLYALVIVLDTIVGSILMNTCKRAYGCIEDQVEDKYSAGHQIEIQDRSQGKSFAKLNALELLV